MVYLISAKIIQMQINYSIIVPEQTNNDNSFITPEKAFFTLEYLEMKQGKFLRNYQI